MPAIGTRSPRPRSRLVRVMSSAAATRRASSSKVSKKSPRRKKRIASGWRRLNSRYCRRTGDAVAAAAASSAPRNDICSRRRERPAISSQQSAISSQPPAISLQSSAFSDQPQRRGRTRQARRARLPPVSLPVWNLREPARAHRNPVAGASAEEPFGAELLDEAAVEDLVVRDAGGLRVVFGRDALHVLQARGRDRRRPGQVAAVEVPYPLEDLLVVGTQVLAEHGDGRVLVLAQSLHAQGVAADEAGGQLRALVHALAHHGEAHRRYVRAVLGEVDQLLQARGLRLDRVG